jgi:phosphate starvation-inducible protein PhoH and related proteins
MARQRQKQRSNKQKETRQDFAPKFTEERLPPPLLPKTDRQADYIAAIMTRQQTISMGCAGTGKTYIAGSIAADLLRLNKIEKIVLTRPNVAAGKSLGFFKGSLAEKIEPWVAPFIEIIKGRLGVAAYDIYLKRGQIEIVPFEVMRGRTFNDAFVILDEAQNTSPDEIKMFLTRIGEGTKVVINGDVNQSDLRGRTSGLTKIIELAQRFNLPIPVIEFTEDDIVRSDICAMWIRAFNRDTGEA